MALSAGSRLGPYEILSPLGAGGMGEVYRARDSRLGRDVAIKVLPEESHSDPERLRRFEQEAKAAGALNHPNVLAVHDVGSHDGCPYLVCELLEGETLRERLRSGSLTPKKALEVGVAIAHGLSAAHGKGIVHRDLKPENVFLTRDGHVKILDFGLAKLAKRNEVVPEAETASQMTAAGSVIGTAGYMSPEQIRGHPADHRSDIFSLGVVLHEMVSGRRPFRGETGADVMTAILREDPPELSAGGATAPPALERIVRRCLEKHADDRFHSAHDLALALEAVSMSSAPQVPAAAVAPETDAARTAVAVLPFVNLSRDPDNEYFADGITEDVIAQLSKIGALRVISRTSAMQFKTRQASLREIGGRLGVGNVLDGSVRRAGSRVRIVAELVDVATEEHLWAETYDRELSDVFAIQSDVALCVAGSLRAVLSPVEKARVQKRPTDNMEAYNEYLLGRFRLNKRNDEGLRLAMAHFERAVALDPGYASAHAGLADAYNLAGAGYLAVPPKDARVRAKAAAQRALELDDTLPEPYTSLGFARMYYEWNYPAAEQAFGKAIELNPSHAPALQWRAQALNAQRRYEEGLECVRRAAELDPLSVVIATEASWPLIYMARHDEGLVQLRKALELDPGFALAHYNVGNCYDRKGMYQEAIAAFEEGVRLSGRLGFMVAGLGRAYAITGKLTEARAILEELLGRAERTSGLALSVAMVYDALGDKDRALGWLEKGYAEREPFVMGLFMEEWLPFENVRREPRFQALLARIEGGEPRG